MSSVCHSFSSSRKARRTCPARGSRVCAGCARIALPVVRRPLRVYDSTGTCSGARILSKVTLHRQGSAKGEVAPRRPAGPDRGAARNAVAYEPHKQRRESRRRWSLSRFARRGACRRMDSYATESRQRPSDHSPNHEPHRTRAEIIGRNFLSQDHANIGNSAVS